MNTITLEQLKDKQNGLNDLLQLHLNDLENTIDKLVGNYPQEESKEESLIEDGILGELIFAQKRLEKKIDKLNNLKQILSNAVIQPISINIDKSY